MIKCCGNSLWLRMFSDAGAQPLHQCLIHRLANAIPMYGFQRTKRRQKHRNHSQGKFQRALAMLSLCGKQTPESLLPQGANDE